jgi:hypothetical protein
MTKQGILKEIQRLAAANGAPPGEKLFCSETGGRQHEWRGKYWARWGDALREAGYAPNQWNESYDEGFLIGKYVALTRETGRLPVQAEVAMKARNDPTFPSMTPFKRLGSKATLLAKIRKYCEAREGHDDITALCQGTSSEEEISSRSKAKLEPDGFVYLLKSGRYYKIGRSISVGQRERQLAIQLPEKVGTIHSIRTDDPAGIEAYWHKRFEAKRMNGEWFNLNAEDIGAFKRRKFM